MALSQSRLRSITANLFGPLRSCVLACVGAKQLLLPSSGGREGESGEAFGSAGARRAAAGWPRRVRLRSSP